MSKALKFSKCNTKKAYAVGIGVTWLKVYESRDEAWQKLQQIKPVYTHDTHGSPNYIHPYIVELQPGDLQLSQIYDGMCCRSGAEFGGQAFDYFPCQTSGFSKKIVHFDKVGNRFAHREW